VTAVTEAPTWPALLTALLRGQDVSTDDAAWAMGQIMGGETSPARLAAFVVALRAKGESPDELAGLVRSMFDHARRITVSGPTVDTCGTGGDRAHTVNISTMSAVVVAATGARVVKHGNRAASSACGSADLLEELGVVVDLAPELVADCVDRAGIAFCFAPLFHPALRHASAVRGQLGIPTVFNFLGPLTNPAEPGHQAVGVADARMADVMAHVLARRGTRALVFRGEDGLDELTVTAPSRVWVVADGTVEETVLDPAADLGIPRVEAAALRGADAPYNAAVAHRVFAGERGAVRDAVVLNAAAALAALDDAPAGTPLVERLRAGLDRAGAVIDDGSVAAALDRWVATSRALAGEA
jgi:anthranilate phosphoribosyltransferase